ncbi:uncharacterized mitochondrial protein AtMg00810-like [Cryptomeria japonica]|uniref:uncharacterized mitochondrial protein AtMg00810-like n=1 Tax=Cryptomeria japonica TaxID=3369 RepID=UPI0027D9DC38|nr:uncharacterized mitochondrial protein AtMg00810-like [Cryptomeria japonica]
MEKFQAEMKQEFEMSDLGLMQYFLCVEVQQTSKGIFISQSNYIADLLKKFNMVACKAFATPIALGEKQTKEDASPKDPNESHWQAGKRILRYVSGTLKFGIQYSPTDKFELVGYTDSDWAGSMDDRKSISGYVFSFGSGVASWSSKKPAIVGLSSTEVKTWQLHQQVLKRYG